MAGGGVGGAAMPFFTGGDFFAGAAFLAGAAFFGAGAAAFLAAFLTTFFAFVAMQISSLSRVVRGLILGVYQFRRNRSKYQSSLRLRWEIICLRRAVMSPSTSRLSASPNPV